MEDFSRDIYEIKEILSISYGDKDCVDNATMVSEKMGAEIDNEYLRKRGEAIKSAECLKKCFSHPSYLKK